MIAPRPENIPRVFLSAEWRYLAMLNYEVDPDLLRNHIPPGTELDSFEGKTFISLVGFRFLRTKVLGIGVPFHRDFDEVNLRFYVRRHANGDLRRGVVFIREIVPRHAIATIARVAYNERYIRLQMRHTIAIHGPGDANIATDYQWRLNGAWNRLYAKASGVAYRPMESSIQQFITEHYWGYSTQRRGGCKEYQVAHEPWRVWDSTAAGFEGDANTLYGATFASVLNRKPDSAFIAEGSPVMVFAGKPVVLTTRTG